MNSILLAIMITAKIMSFSAAKADINHNLMINYIKDGKVTQITLDEFNKLPAQDKLQFLNELEAKYNADNLK